ncbi:MAG: ABC transporter ATP-binding protein/permease [Bacilli bacterium]|nr:ABC transporter ATP-binding protein/permease [Bacilli bacterium]
MERVILLGKYLKKYYKQLSFFLILGVVALVVVDIVETEVPKFLKDIVDNIDGMTTPALWEILWKVLLCALVIVLGRVGWRLCIMYASKKIAAGLRGDMFQKSLRLSNSFYHENKTGTIMSWFTTDIETIEEYFGWGTVMLVDAVFLSLIVLIRMIMVDYALTLVAAIPIILIGIWGFLVEKLMGKKWEERQKAYDDLYGFTEESFSGVRVIKAFVKETNEIHSFAKIVRKNKDVNYNFAKIEVFFDVMIHIIINATIALVLGFGGFFIFQAYNGNGINIFGHVVDITVGQLMEFLAYFDLLVWPMIAAGQIITMKSRAKTSLKRITRFLDVPEDVKSPENATKLSDVKGEITFKDFSFKYESETENVLKNVSLTIKPGELIGVVGKIGSGKTSLATALLRLYNFKEGTLFIDGVDLMKADIESLRENISYAPQDNFLFSDTIANNISFSSSAGNQKDIENAADFADISSNIDAFPNKYETVSGEKGVTLSGGQKQRISLARAYYKNSPIMIMDDTVSAVDVKTEETILKNINEQRKGKTTIVIASRVSTVRHFDRIIVLKDGEVEAFDSHDNLMKTSKSYQRMVYLQQLEAEMEGGKNNG